MPARRTHLVAASALAGLLVLALAGCAENSTRPVTDYRGEPKGVQAPASSAGGAPFSMWLKGGDQFTVTLYGSANCPPVVTRYRLVGHNQMVLTVTDSSVASSKKTPGAVTPGEIASPTPGGKGTTCTPGYIPHTTVFATPNTVDVHSDVSITGDGMSWTLAGLPAS